MSDSELSPEERRQGARCLFGYAVKHEPISLYATMGEPLPSRLGGRATRFIVDQLHQEKGRTVPSEVTSLLEHGITDTQNLLHDHFVQLAGAHGPAAAEAFGRHETTVRTVAQLALRTEESMRGAIDSHERHDVVADAFLADESALHIKPGRLVPHEHHGCPLAGHDGELDIDPLFTRFVGWTSTLCVASIAAHILKNK